MSKRQQSQGCRPMLRRTFLFLTGIALARVLADYFAIAQNRDSFLTLAGKLWQKSLAFLSKKQSDGTPQPLPNNPLVKSGKTPQLLPNNPIVKSPKTPQPNVTNSPVVQSQNPIIRRSAKQAKPVEVKSQTVADASFYLTTIDLADPEIYITIGLANNAALANNSKLTAGDEPFENMVERYQAAVVANGTFFGKDEQKSVLGNMVSAGKFLKYSRWENYGTTLGIKAGNQLEMVTARIEGKPDWSQHWFSLTCGPRLVKGGKVWLSPLSEGFKDSHVLGVGSRTAIGFPASRDKLFLVTFLDSLSLEAEAKVMLAIGCFEAMNLDGGASVGLAHQGQILLPAGRNLTNVLVIYDKEYPAPATLKQSWERFQKVSRPTPDKSVFFD
ncbi:phosphodiester glycosidase family protein [Microcoleus sp. LEGE 07076]|uniref:phosphodiester glycosidase family protein n=1 Tax=Microcoleus sp. LEGE 07076 TaxID=915322 RepID=UPI00188047A0|nr:phosphodiester glycosidase family protein [Microcoleus sp. LEGE 07076]MBE9184228.1 phosphodiester glycosidase family protein [Microcoleus sp. LEGE 07076]